MFIITQEPNHGFSSSTSHEIKFDAMTDFALTLHMMLCAGIVGHVVARENGRVVQRYEIVEGETSNEFIVIRHKN